MSVFKPKFFTCIRNYNVNQFGKDITSGVIVAIIALPLSIALAIASGVSPEKGLHTAIIAGFLISLLGGSRVQIGGPTGAFMIIVYGIVTQYGIDGLIISTIMAGIILVLMGFFRLGSIIKFIPYPITTGFTGGIALVIFSSQIKDFFGLSIEKLPADTIGKWYSYFVNINTINWTSLILGILSLLIIIFWPKINRKIPGSLVALVVVTAAAYMFNLDVETIGSKYGELSSSLPMPQIPALKLNEINHLIGPAFTIAVLGGIESLLSAVVADGMISGKHRSNTELIAQGIANIASGLFGGIPATGAIARTAANIKNGGRTPVAGMVHSITLLLIMLVLMPYARLIPLCTLAAILMVVAYNMSEWRTFKALLKAPKSDIFVLLTTFLLTVFIDLVYAIEVGVVLSSLLFMKRMADVTNIKSIIMDVSEEDGFGDEIIAGDITNDILIFEVNGPLFFGAADKFMEVSRQVQGPSKVVILNMANVPVMDATAFHAMEILYKTCKDHKTKLLLSNVQCQPYSVLKQGGLIRNIGDECICADINEALRKAA